MNKLITLLLSLSFVFANAQTVSIEEFSNGYNWLVGFEHPPGDDRLFVFQKDGYIKICNPDGQQAGTFLNISNKVNNSFNNEQGLVGVAFHPNYAVNGYFYVFYNQINTGICTIARYTRSIGAPNVANINSEQILLTWPHPNANHVGGCLKFGPDGYLYIASGDGGGAGDPNGNGQNLQTYLGKILRLDVDNGTPYSVPADNPFLGNPNALPEIWAYGLRNPWRFSFDSYTGDLWIADVGQDEREEIDYQPVGSMGGQNYGWSCMEGTFQYNANQCDVNAAYTPPLYEYSHQNTNDCSISGGVVYRGGEFADLFGKYIYTDFCSGRIWSLDKSGAQPVVVEGGNFNDNEFTLLDENNKGELFVAGFFSNKIWRVRSQNCAPVAWVPGPDSYTLAPGGSVDLSLYPITTGMNYQWTLDGNPLAGQDGPTLTASQAGVYTVVVTNPANNCLNESGPIMVLTNETLTIAGAVDVCENSTVVYSVPPVSGAVYQWTFSGVSEVNGLGTTQLSITWGDFTNIGQVGLMVTFPSGDIQSGSLEINIHPNDLALNPQLTHISCAGGNDGIIQLNTSGGGGNYSYLWNTGATMPIITNLSTGNYSVTVTDAYGCEAMDVFNVVDPPGLFVNFMTHNITCYGGNDGEIYVENLPPFICAMNWDTPILSNLSAAIYSVTITDCNGCMSLQEVTLSQPQEPLLTYTAFPPSPGQSDGIIAINIAGGSPGYMYVWNTGDTTATITGLSAGIYSLTVTDANGCTLEETIALGVLISTKEIAELIDLQVFPNPVKDGLTVRFSLPSAMEMSLEIKDLFGREIAVIWPYKLHNPGQYNLPINTAGWGSGLYFLNIKTEDGNICKKIIKL